MTAVVTKLVCLIHSEEELLSTYAMDMFRDVSRNGIKPKYRTNKKG